MRSLFKFALREFKCWNHGNVFLGSRAEVRITGNSRWRHGTETLSALQALCEGNTSVTTPKIHWLYYIYGDAHICNVYHMKYAPWFVVFIISTFDMRMCSILSPALCLHMISLGPEWNIEWCICSLYVYVYVYVHICILILYVILLIHSD